MSSQTQIRIRELEALAHKYAKNESEFHGYNYEDLYAAKFAELVTKTVVARFADLGAIDVDGEFAKTIVEEFTVPTLDV